MLTFRWKREKESKLWPRAKLKKKRRDSERGKRKKRKKQSEGVKKEIHSQIRGQHLGTLCDTTNVCIQRHKAGLDTNF